MWSPPGIAAPRALIGPVHALVAGHESVQVESRLDDGQRGAHLRVVDCVPHVHVALEHVSLIDHCLQAHLQFPHAESSHVKVAPEHNSIIDHCLHTYLHFPDAKCSACTQVSQSTYRLCTFSSSIIVCNFACIFQTQDLQYVPHCLGPTYRLHTFPSSIIVCKPTCRFQTQDTFACTLVPRSIAG